MYKRTASKLWVGWRQKPEQAGNTATFPYSNKQKERKDHDLFSQRQLQRSPTGVLILTYMPASAQQTQTHTTRWHRDFTSKACTALPERHKLVMKFFFFTLSKGSGLAEQFRTHDSWLGKQVVVDLKLWWTLPKGKGQTQVHHKHKVTAKTKKKNILRKKRNLLITRLRRGLLVRFWLFPFRHWLNSWLFLNHRFGTLAAIRRGLQFGSSLLAYNEQDKKKEAWQTDDIKKNWARKNGVLGEEAQAWMMCTKEEGNFAEREIIAKPLARLPQWGHNQTIKTVNNCVSLGKKSQEGTCGHMR